MFLDTKGRTERDAEGKDCRIVEDTLHTKTKTAREPVELNTAGRTQEVNRKKNTPRTHEQPRKQRRTLQNQQPGLTPGLHTGFLRYYCTLYLIALHLYGSGKSTCNYFDHPFKGAPSFLLKERYKSQILPISSQFMSRPGHLRHCPHCFDLEKKLSEKLAQRANPANPANHNESNHSCISRACSIAFGFFRAFVTSILFMKFHERIKWHVVYNG